MGRDDSGIVKKGDTEEWGNNEERGGKILITSRKGSYVAPLISDYTSCMHNHSSLLALKEF